MSEECVECKVCGFKGKMLNRHLAKHGMTAVEYHAKFPDSKLALDEIYRSQAEKVSGQRKPPRELVCRYCGGRFNNREVLWLHEKKEITIFANGVEGEAYLSCALCGQRAENLVTHLSEIHNMSSEEYRNQFPNSRVIVERLSKIRAAVGASTRKPVSEKRGAMQCVICSEWYQHETAQAHREKCVAAHPDKYELGKEYVRCPECNGIFLKLGKHLRDIHGWDKDKIRMESNKGLLLMASNLKNKMYDVIDRVAAQEKREQTHLERHGYANPFANPETQKKIVETSQRRYGVSHAMQNEEVFSRQRESAHKGPSEQELFFDEHTCDQCVFTGWGGRFIRTKTGVHKYGRLIKNLNPDFMILPRNVLESALAAVRERRPLDREKHRSRYVVELLGDYYHSKEVIGVEPVEHEKELVAAYKSAGIECLVLWEKDVLHRWESVRPLVDAWIEKAVMDMNERPIFSRATKSNIDRRKGDLVAPDGSGRKFKSHKQLEKWMASPVNYWKAGLVEGKDFCVCRECNTRVSKVTEHIRRAHGMTKEQYLLKYPDAQMVSERVSESKSNEPRGDYMKRIAYRCPNGSIVGKRDAWIRAWGAENPPADTIVDGSLFDPWKNKILGVDFVVCSHCGYKAANLARHLKREHGGIEGYQGQVKSQKCVENLTAGANMAWDVRGRKPDKDASQNKTRKQHGLTREILEQLYGTEGLSDAKIGEKYSMTGEGIAYQRKKFGITTRARIAAAHRLSA